MPSKSLFFAVSAFAGTALVSAQSAPNWVNIPSACADPCSQTVESAYLCQTQYASDSTSIYGCFCNSYPSDAETCASCLNDNNAAVLGSLLTSTQTACPQAIQSCFISCSFDTCGPDDVACQCSGEYLSNIFNCGSCNTANGNTDATQLKDWEALQDSCKNQDYTAAMQSFTTKSLPTATTDGYQAPALTATGGGAAATGNAAATDEELAAGGKDAGTPATAAVVVNSSSASKPTTVAAVAQAASSAVAQAASSAVASKVTTSKSVSVVATAAGVASATGAASSLTAPGLGGIIAFVGAIAALV